MNELTEYFVPQWVSLAFLFSIPLPFILLSLFVHKQAKSTKYNKAYIFVIGFFILYLAYIAVAAYHKWFNIVSMPPRVLLLTTVPFAALLFIGVAKTKVYQTLLEKASLQSMVRLHIFRIIGIFFVLLALHDALPKPFGFIAGFGDVITALSSVIVAKAIAGNKAYAKKLTYYWNIFGTIDIVFTAVAANVLTKMSIDSGVMGVDSLAFFPFCIIPAFAPPTILFLHWSIFKKLKTLS